MGRRGPPPMPTKLKLLRGNPGKRPINKREPKPKRETPRCPVWLTPEAKKFWKQIVPELRRLGVLTVVDGPALTNLCQTYVRWRAAEEFIAKHGECYPLRSQSGQIRYMQQFPQVSIARNLLHQLRGFYQEFGLTPASRTRIEVNDRDGRLDDDDAFRLKGCRSV